MRVQRNFTCGRDVLPDPPRLTTVVDAAASALLAAAFSSADTNVNDPSFSIDHLLDQVEQYRQRRAVRDSRPDELATFVDRVAATFEPTHGVGRVGFDCKLSEHGWIVSMFLGDTEIVGGRDDGLVQHNGFHVDIQRVSDEFTNVDEIRFTSAPDQGVIDAGVTIRGAVSDLLVTLLIHAFPPAQTQPGFQRMPDRTLRLSTDEE